MTCIVGFIEDEKVYIGGDSAGVAGYDITLREDPKVFINDQMIIGFTTSFRMGQILRFCLKPPTQDPGQSDFEYLCTDFVDAVMKCFKEKKFTRTDEGRASGGSFLLGYKGGLYNIESNFQVGQSSDKYDATGCGESYAKGALMALEGVALTPEDRVLKALAAAEKFSAGVCAPFKVLSM